MAKQGRSSNVFKVAVEATPDISAAYKSGLQALRHADASKVTTSVTRKIDGSVNIDETLQAAYPDANRWDYAIGYDSKVCFVEVHPAFTSEIDTMLKKLAWLKGWLKDKAPKLNEVSRMTPAFVWIQSGRCAILPTSRQAKKLAQTGMPRPLLRLG